MKGWKLEVVDKDGVVLEKLIIKDNSKFAVKKRARVLVDKTPQAQNCFIYQMEEDGEKD